MIGAIVDNLIPIAWGALATAIVLLVAVLVRDRIVDRRAARRDRGRS